MTLSLEAWHVDDAAALITLDVTSTPTRANRAMTLFTSLGPSADCRGLT
jgi:hypothetical protein